MDALADRDSWEPVADGLSSRDPLTWEGYEDALAAATRSSGVDESVKAGPAMVGGHRVEFAAFNFDFIGGSMGEVAGERLARAMERAAARGVPFLLHTSTGGARMQEGMRSLVQMPKVVSARMALATARCPFIAVLGHPTTGGVLASIGSLADATIATSGATIGFAGPRVAESFVGRPLREGSHTAEAAFIHGLVDEVSDASELKETVIACLAAFATDTPEDVDPPSQPAEIAPQDDAWEVVTAARDDDRQLAHELLLEMTESLFPLHGDRAGTNDPAVDVALCRIYGRRVIALALDRERAPGPGAYRKARRGIALAERLNVPVVTLIDTRGADPSDTSEAGGIAWEIGALFEAMLSTPVPTVGVVTGEGGSGGALAFGCTDVLLAYEGSFFSVIGPELAAEILWRDATKGREAAQRLRPTAADLMRLGVADGLIPDPPEPRALKRVIAYHLARLEGDSAVVERRLKRWRDGFGDREAST